MNTKKFTTQEITLIAIFSSIVAITSQINIPMPYGVPLTLQTLIIPLVGIILGPKKGTFSILVYILLGIIGIPVFAGFSSGFGAILGPTGGFIISFPILALTAGIGAKKSTPIFLFSLILGTIINFLVGLIVFSYVTQYNYALSFTYCVLPYIPTTIIKIIIIFLFGKKLKISLLKKGINL